ncbi:MAG: S8 family serine peptidase [Phycisphaerae bacterium]|nr:S8 family serine peptidase [Phycisphaerae bacterium]
MKTNPYIGFKPYNGIVAKPARRRAVLVGLTSLAVVLLLSLQAAAIHSPKEWYDTSTLDDADGDKIEDVLQTMRQDEPVDVFICFLDDCRPNERINHIVLCLGGKIGYASTVVSSVMVTGLTPDKLAIIAQWPEVGYIHLDHIMEPHMTTSGKALKAHMSTTYSPNTAEDQGYSGSGITIAILDTGVDDPGGAGTTHNHLPTAVSAPGVAGLYINASNNLAFGNPDDQQGHGTSVAGCALGRGNASGNYRGIAPAANLFDCRITPPGTGGSTSESNIQKAVDWLTWNHNSVSPAVRVANISFGSYCKSSYTALTASIDALANSGVVVCVSAGNNNSCAGWPTQCNGAQNGMGSIAIAARAITVAAATHSGTVARGDDVIANYSRVGPGSGPVSKPDITAYGNQCTRACPTGCVSGTSTNYIQAPKYNTTVVYRNFGGTSAASPMVAGAAALILQMNPAMTVQAVKKLLMDNAQDMGAVGPDTTWGNGLMDLGAIFVAPPACDLQVTTVSYTPNPVVCKQPATITVTVKNVGAVAVTNFSVDFQRWYFGPNSAPAQRFQIVASPVNNTAGALAVNATRQFQTTWTPGVSDKLPMSQHTCFWGIVNASCDTNAGNNERNINATIVGVKNYSCKKGAFSQTASRDGVIDFKFRIGHDLQEPAEVMLCLQNYDPYWWHAELEVNDWVSQECLYAWVDNQECAVWGTLRAWQLDEWMSPDTVELRVEALLWGGDPIGEMNVVADLSEPLEACCLLDGTCEEYPPEDCPYYDGFVVYGTGCLGDADSNGTDDACEQASYCGDGVCDPGEEPCNCPSDCGDPTCCEVPGLTCTNGWDDDCDLRTDCDDPDCLTDPACIPREACCLNDGTCVDQTLLECFCSNGVPQGAGTDCSTVTCPQPGSEACCFQDNSCQDMQPVDCLADGGFPQGLWTTCATIECPDGDFDDDGDVDLIDFAGFQFCFGQTTLPSDCEVDDFDANDIIDLVDYAEFVLRLSGPGGP